MFRKGDKVVCVDAENTPLTEGNTYTVEDYHTAWDRVFINGCNGGSMFYPRRFRLAEPALLPCPFCNGAKHLSRHRGYFVECQDCWAVGPMKPTLAEAEAAWNAAPRPVSPAPTLTADRRNRLLEAICNAHCTDGIEDELTRWVDHHYQQQRPVDPWYQDAEGRWRRRIV